MFHQKKLVVWLSMGTYIKNYKITLIDKLLKVIL